MVELVKSGRDLFQLAIKEQQDKVCSRPFWRNPFMVHCKATFPLPIRSTRSSPVKCQWSGTGLARSA